MNTDMNETNTPAAEERDAKQEARRAFLKKSIYAAYATPVLMSLLVEKANAAHSWNPGQGNRPPKPPKPPWEK